MGIFIGILEEGLIYAILALGVLITYRILDFPDLTVDSSFPLGAAVSAILTVNGMHPVLTLLMATLAGAAAGLVTGLIHVKCHVRDLLSGIITMTGLYSINLRIAGRANLPFFNMDTLFDNALVDSLPAALAPWSKVLVVLVIVLVALLVLLINHTKVGMAMRAVAKDFETSQLMGIKINRVISVTFVIGSFLAGVGSLLYFTNYTTVIQTSGAMPGLKAFVAAVFGGIGSVPGAVVGAFIIGICENIIKGLDVILIKAGLSKQMLGLTTFSDAFTFALLIVILIVKPTGLFGEKTTDKV